MKRSYQITFTGMEKLDEVERLSLERAVQKLCALVAEDIRASTPAVPSRTLSIGRTPAPYITGGYGGGYNPRLSASLQHRILQR